VRRGVLDRLASPRLTVALLAALGALLLLGLAVPQRAVLQGERYGRWAAENPWLVTVLEGAGLTDLHHSVLAYGVWALFFANLLAAMAARTAGIVRRVRLAGAIPAPLESGFPFRATIAAPRAGALAEARGVLARAGYAVREADGRLRAARHRWSPLATVVFHLSFVVILAGIAATTLTRFEGTIDLAVGEAFDGDLRRFASTARARFAEAPTARFAVEGVETEVVGNVAVRVQVHLRDAQLRAQTIEVNHPWVAGDGTSYVIKDLGVAPLLVVTDRDGKELGGGTIRLDVLGGRTDRFQLLGKRLEARFFPDWYLDGDEDATRSPAMRNPALQLAMRTDTGKVFRRTIRVGEAVEFGPYVVAFPDWRWWARLHGRSERGIALVFGGLAMGVLAVAWRLALRRRDLLVALAPEGGALEVAGRADHYRALFADEFEDTVATLRRAVEAP
jgi:cytochrome c biogenesis protein ResB